MLAEDPGVVLTGRPHRSRAIYAPRDRANQNGLKAGPWEPADPSYTYQHFARYNGDDCASYEVGRRRIYREHFEGRQAFPPDRLPAFLMMSILEPVPPELEKFASSKSADE